MKRLAFALLLAGAISPLVVSAEVRPQGGSYDHRIRYVNYNPDDVVAIIGHYGYSTAIELGQDEEVFDIALGDSLAWDVAPRGNFIFLKPRESKPTTNMTVVTNKRSYQFWLDAHTTPNKGRADDMFFAVRFRYPLDELRLAREADARRRAEQALRSAPVPSNWDYWACGARTLRPTEVFDDGRFTYLRFPAAQEVPAAYVINSDGTEAMASGTMRGDQLVLQVVAPKIILRKGKAVACVQNRSFNPYGVYTPTSTTSPAVERVMNTDAPAPQPKLPTRPQVDSETPSSDDEAMQAPVLPGIAGLPGLPAMPGALPMNPQDAAQGEAP